MSTRLRLALIVELHLTLRLPPRVLQLDDGCRGARGAGGHTDSWTDSWTDNWTDVGRILDGMFKECAYE